MTRGLEFFERAAELDPSYAPAYAGIADSTAFLIARRKPTRCSSCFAMCSATDTFDIALAARGVDISGVAETALHRRTRAGAAIGGAGLPTVLCMEGGYAIGDIGANVANVLTGFAGSTP